jgi:hypothetical protein
MAYGEHPDFCLNGHALTGPHKDFSLSWLPCSCNLQPGRGRGHLTLTCHKDGCGLHWYDPPHDGDEWIPANEVRGRLPGI